MAASAADTGTGATFAIGDGATPTEAFTAVAEVMSITPPGKTREAIDVTHLTSDDGYREFIASGVVDAGEVSLSMNYIESASHTVEALIDSGKQNFRVAFPGGVTMTFAAVPTAFEYGELVDGDKMTATATFKVSGQPVFA